MEMSEWFKSYRVRFRNSSSMLVDAHDGVEALKGAIQYLVVEEEEKPCPLY